MLLHDARRETRVDAAGELVLLDEQDRTRWDQAKMQEGIAVLDEAMALNDPRPYQVQAAISALHADAPTAEATDWSQIAALYGTLAKMTPSMVVEVNRAVAVAMASGAETGLEMLHSLESEADGYYPYHAGARRSAAPDPPTQGSRGGICAGSGAMRQPHRARLSSATAGRDA